VVDDFDEPFGGFWRWIKKKLNRWKL